MAIVFPQQKIGRSSLGLGFNSDFLHENWSFDLGEQYYRDPDFRVQMLNDMNNTIYEIFGKIGLGSSDPISKIIIEPFGHRFLTAMYGCKCDYRSNGEPWTVVNPLTDDEIMHLPEWTVEKLVEAEPVKEILAQTEYIKRKYSQLQVKSLPNLGSPLNTSLGIQGDDLFYSYIDKPHIVDKFCKNIAQLMIVCMEFFPGIDNIPIRMEGIGNCSATMLSPADYMRCNYFSDKQVHNYCSEKKMKFLLHQDSGISPHLENYSQLGNIDSFDVGNDTDFDKLYKLFPDATVNCILFPHFVIGESDRNLKKKLEDLMVYGDKFTEFTFSLYEIDSAMSIEDVFHFNSVFTEVANSRIG